MSPLDKSLRDDVSWLATLPSTNVKIVVALAVFVFAVVWVLVLSAFKVVFADNALGFAETLTLAFGGFGVAQFIGKRVTDNGYRAQEAAIKSGVPVGPTSPGRDPASGTDAAP